MSGSSGGAFKWIVILALLLLGVYWFTSGGRAQFGVIQDKVLGQLNRVLGELAVKEKEIDNKRRDISADMDSVRMRKTEAKVRQELLVKKQEVAKQDLVKLKQGLERIKPKMEAARSQGKIELNGREVTADELNRMASELVSRVKSKDTEINSQQINIDALQRTVDFLASQEKAAADLLSKLDLKINEIKDKKVTIDAVKTANALGQNDSSLTDKINSLSKEIDKMFVDVETTMRVEEDKLKDLKNQTLTADELLSETGSDLESTMGEIDAILGKGGGN